MAIAKMNKVYLIAHQAEKKEVLSILQQAGMVEISDLQAKGAGREPWAELVESDQDQEALQELEAGLTDVRFAMDFLNRHYPAKKSLMDSLGGSKAAVSVRELDASAVELAQISKDVYSALRAADDKLIALRNEETRLQNLKLQLLPWSKLEARLEEVRATPSARLELGALPAAELAACRDKLAALEAVILEEVNVDRGEAYVFAAYAASLSEEAQAVLKEHNFNKQSFHDLSGTPSENIARLDEELAAAAADRDSTLKSAGEQAAFRDSLHRYNDFLIIERDKKQAVASLARTSNSFVVEGWIREADLPVIKERLSTLETVEMVARAPLDGETFPVALENKRSIAPFEFVTKLYGTPHPYGVDPTFALTPFFIIFFGLSMTDAGYGFIIVALAALGLWKLKLGGGGRKIMWVLLAGGISTIFFGALLGGWFGGLIPLEPLFFNALDDPMRLLIYALAIGIFQIFIGMAIKFYTNVKEGKILDAIFDQGFWYLFIIGLLLLVAPGLGGIAKLMSIGGAAGLVLTQGRTQPTLVKKFLSGVLSLYNITGYLSDVLSYSRLLALGLATGVIALAINTMADVLPKNIFGYAFMVLLLICGHAFNLVINTLSAYIHSSRLQYIEFYNRFYEGGGRTFVPFRLNTRHIEVVPEWQEGTGS
ncbi:MAG: V-type ATP synthase subunit I [Dethiobacter sp.]|jgi:V/A-type H+-transporting ATPase subunit I|nr:V-type ATP synthase subunit I [Dethiobacter sp.]